MRYSTENVMCEACGLLIGRGEPVQYARRGPLAGKRFHPEHYPTNKANDSDYNEDAAVLVPASVVEFTDANDYVTAANVRMGKLMAQTTVAAPITPEAPKTSDPLSGAIVAAIWPSLSGLIANAKATSTGDSYQALELANEYTNSSVKNANEYTDSSAKLTRELTDLKLNEAKLDLIEVMTEKLASFKPSITTIEVNNIATGVTVNVGVQHHTFPLLLQVLSQKLNVWLTGPAGSGKTTAAHNCAKALNLPFAFCGAQSNEYGLLGFTTATGTTVRTPFREVYENGGVFLFDEIDASSASAVLAFNAALANGVCNFPDKMVERHPDFICIAAANTFGLGATSEYVGRMKQDSAFLDRFCFVAWDVDEQLEKAMCGNDSWCSRVQYLRANAKRNGIKVIISPRASLYGAKLLASGMDQATVETICVKRAMTTDQWQGIQAEGKQ
jgi:hypothetical protein